MTKTFDQLFSEIVGENIVNPQQMNQTQQQNNQQTPPVQNNQNKQEDVPEEIAKLFIAAKTPQEVNAAYTKLQQMKQQSPNTQPNQQQYSNNNAANQQA
jgi:hypothetical protein